MSTDFIDQLQAYNTCQGEVRRIEMLRDLCQTMGDYYWQGVVSPSKNPSVTNGIRLDAYQTFEEQLQFPVGTLIYAISTYSEQPEGFVLQMDEVTSESHVFQNMMPRAKGFGNYDSNGLVKDVPLGPTILNEGVIVLQKQKIGITLKNLSTSANMVQVFIECAIPVSAQSVGGAVVQRNG